MENKPSAPFSYKRIDTNMLSANINRDRITQADIHALAVTSKKDERNTKPLFKVEPNTKPNSISIDKSLNITLLQGF